MSTEEDHVILRRSSKKDPQKSRHRYESASRHGAQRVPRDPSPGMSPIAVRHFEHGSEASTRFTCALAYIYVYPAASEQQKPFAHVRVRWHVQRCPVDQGKSPSTLPYALWVQLCAVRRGWLPPPSSLAAYGSGGCKRKAGFCGTHVTANGSNG